MNFGVSCLSDAITTVQSALMTRFNSSKQTSNRGDKSDNTVKEVANWSIDINILCFGGIHMLCPYFVSFTNILDFYQLTLHDFEESLNSK